MSQNALGNMQNLKASLPSPALDTNDSRQPYTSHLMVLPSGQTVPLNNYYSQQNGTDNSQLSYVPTNMFPGFMGNSTLQAGTFPSYSWPYGLTPGGNNVDAGRRASWSSNDESVPMSQPLANTNAQEWYPSMAYAQGGIAPQSAHYIAGPIQPMKCADNKSYEMVNMDELVSRDPPIPRAVPALWTNQEELSLAKCLQNPEGITNVYIRGFMPDTTDEDLQCWAARFGEIESCKAIIEQDTGNCKGYEILVVVVLPSTDLLPDSASSCTTHLLPPRIVSVASSTSASRQAMLRYALSQHLGIHPLTNQKSRNSRLKDLEDRASTNIYCTGVPIDWNESVRLPEGPRNSLLTTHRTLPNTFSHSMLSPPRFAVMCHRVSARKLALQGTLQSSLSVFTC